MATFRSIVETPRRPPPSREAFRRLLINFDFPMETDHLKKSACEGTMLNSEADQQDHQKCMQGMMNGEAQLAGASIENVDHHHIEIGHKLGRRKIPDDGFHASSCSVILKEHFEGGQRQFDSDVLPERRPTPPRPERPEFDLAKALDDLNKLVRPDRETIHPFACSLCGKYEEGHWFGNCPLCPFKMPLHCHVCEKDGHGCDVLVQA